MTTKNRFFFAEFIKVSELAVDWMAGKDPSSCPMAFTPKNVAHMNEEASYVRLGTIPALFN